MPTRPTPTASPRGFTGFEHERRTYEAHKAELLKNEGKYVAIKGDELTEVFETYGDVLEAGYRRFGLTPFMVKQIQTVEEPLLITRLVAPCRS